MKIYRSKDFNTSNSQIWKDNILRLGNNKGEIFTARTVFTGFGISKSTRSWGPVTIDNIPENTALGNFSQGRAVSIELKFQDSSDAGKQETPSSMYVEPFWLIYSLFQGFQLYIDSWVGMKTIDYYNSEGKLVGSFGGNSVADTRGVNRQPVIKYFRRDDLLPLLNSQFGKCHLAIDSYTKACTEIVDYSIIDFIVVLENLLGRGIGRGLSHGLSVRSAHILSSKGKLKSEYYSGVKYLYDLRSKIVHGEIDEIVVPNTKKKAVLKKLGINVDCEPWEMRYEISEFARSVARGVLLYFINNEEKLNKKWLRELELGLVSA